MISSTGSSRCWMQAEVAPRTGRRRTDPAACVSAQETGIVCNTVAFSSCRNSARQLGCPPRNLLERLSFAAIVSARSITVAISSAFASPSIGSKTRLLDQIELLAGHLAPPYVAKRDIRKAEEKRNRSRDTPPRQAQLVLDQGELTNDGFTSNL